jgi:subtilisin family serine protease
VTVAAPGCASTTWLGGSTVANFCGTSTAAPYVAGVAGLARSFRRDVSPAALAGALGASARTLQDGSIASHGVVDANGLLVALGAPSGRPLLGTRPSVARKPAVGRPAAAFAGGWRQASSVSIRWERSRDGRRWRTVGSGRTFLPRRSDLGFRLRVVVDASNIRGTTAVVSTATAPVRSTTSA